MSELAPLDWEDLMCRWNDLKEEIEAELAEELTLEEALEHVEVDDSDDSESS